MKRFVKYGALLGASLCLISFASQARENATNQVNFRGGFSHLTSSRGGEVFTDTLGTSGLNDNKNGFSVATSVNLGLTDYQALFNRITLQGEVFMEYSRFSHATVRQTTSALLAGTTNSGVSVSELNVSVNPKARFEFGRWRPYVIPVGIAFLVNSPPSNDSTYLDIGVNTGVGLDVKLTELLSLGTDLRYTYAFDQSNTKNSYLSTGAYLGINF